MTIDTPIEHAQGNDSDRPDQVLSPLSRSQAALLVDLALAAAARLGLDVTYEGDAALVPFEPSASGPVLGLSNLARGLSRFDEEHWPALVDEHFTELLGRLRDGPPPPPDDPQESLIQRLVPRDALPADWTADRPDFVPGLLSVPSTAEDGVVTMYLEPSDLGLTWSEAERIGLSNLRRLTDHVEYVEHDDIRIALVTGSAFAASRALVLDTVLRESLHVESIPHGALVALPIRDLLLVHVIKDLSVIPALGLLLNLAARAHSHDPGPLTPDVFLAIPDSAPHRAPDSRRTSGNGSGAGSRLGPLAWHPATTVSLDHTPLRLSPQLDSLTKLLAELEPAPSRSNSALGNHIPHSETHEPGGVK